MSWSSRFGSWASPGRWSPFARPGHSSQQDEEISDSDFSYITPDDLEYTRRPSTHTHRPSHSHSRSPNPQMHSHGAPLRGARDSDVVLLRHKKISYPVHCTAYSIDDGTLRIGDIRESAAKKLDVRDPRRIRMYYKGRNLKDDGMRCCDEGLRSDVESDILIVVGAEVPDADVSGDRRVEESGGHLRPHAHAPAHSHGRSHEEANDEDGGYASPLSGSDGDEDDEDNDEREDREDGVAAAGGKRRNRNRSRKKKNRNAKKGSSPLSGAGASNSGSARAPATQTVEHLPVPSGTHPIHRETSHTGSASASSQGAQPQASSSRGHSPAAGGPLEKLGAIASNFHTTLVPQCIQFSHSPPSDRAKREFEHKKLTETILAQVLLKLDAVETEGNEEARARRKELVKEVQGMLTRLDEVVKK